MAGRVRMREMPVLNGGEPAAGPPPLRVSGLVVAKADLVAALRAFVPALVDLSVTEDGEHFWLVLGKEAPDADSTAG